jgi:hypothetical protein
MILSENRIPLFGIMLGYFTFTLALLTKKPWPLLPVQVRPLVDDWQVNGPLLQLLP